LFVEHPDPRLQRTGSVLSAITSRLPSTLAHLFRTSLIIAARSRATDHHWRPRAIAARQLPIIWLTVDKNTRIGPVRLTAMIVVKLDERCCPVGDNNGQRFFWAIDYYDETCTYRSRDPCDEFVTTRCSLSCSRKTIKLRSSELFHFKRTLTTG